MIVVRTVSEKNMQLVELNSRCTVARRGKCDRGMLRMHSGPPHSDVREPAFLRFLR